MKIFTAFASIGVLALGSALAHAEPPQQSDYTPPQQPPQGQQQGQQSPYGQQPGQGRQQVSEEQLQQFSDAMDEVSEVQQEYAQAIREADDMDKAQNLRAEAQKEMRSAVEDTGLSVPEYNMISQQLRSDQELVQRLQEIHTE